MQIFYCSETDGKKATFSPEESGHCIRVLRMRKGDPVFFTDGKGNMYEGFVSNPDNRKMEVTVSSVTPDHARRDYRVHIAISPLKNNDRFEWFVEKAVEIGIDEITPLICSRTEKTHIKSERIENLILSAMKQSIKAYLPLLNEPLTADDFIAGSFSGRKLIAHCNDELPREAINNAIRKNEDVVIMIGPEGDFTPEEVSKAVQAGFASVHLGNSRLRTETAGVIACCSAYLANLND